MNSTVCAGAITHATTSARARWIEKHICNGNGPRKALGGQLPLCIKGLRDGAVSLNDFAPQRRIDNMSSKREGLLHVIFIDDRASPNIASMLDVARLGNGTMVRFVALLRNPPSAVVQTLRERGVSIIKLDEAALPNHAVCVHRGLSRLVPRGSRMRGAALYKPMLHWLLPRHMQHVLVIDSDTVPLKPLETLLDEIPKMRSQGALVGLVPEQSRFYRGGQQFQMAPGVIGYNGGVQLHDLARMRNSPAWDAVLDATQAGLLVYKIGYSGDQNLYNVMVSLFPHMFHTLGCEWNRQLGSWAMGSKVSVKQQLQDDPDIHACKQPCALLHFNAFKCGASMMHAASGSCTTWEHLLAEIDRTSHTRVSTASRNRTGATPREDVAHTPTCPDPRSQVWRLHQLHDDHLLASAMRKWFSDCCV